jgi:hypothetical protein
MVRKVEYQPHRDDDLQMTVLRGVVQKDEKKSYENRSLRITIGKWKRQELVFLTLTQKERLSR